ncbi:hypothetical protein [Uliginosibacterium sp. H1]|uniref:hypothetical protein n=1 Tax=Uliginosibacterium sp. H1 TaxID=3114757 RepID=UPI002E188B3C|nr:hypothetical protein [Uliginosibacterium sp. H1]
MKLSRTRVIYAGTLMLALSATAPAHAAGAGVRIGTTGLGGDVAFELIPTLSARLGYSYATYNTTLDDTDVSYDADIRLSNFNAFLDWSPLPGPFRLTAGLIPNGNRIKVNGRPTNGNYVINGQTYSASQIGSLDGEIKSGNSVAPYLGIGWGTVAGAGVNFYADLGVMYMGTPSSSLNVACGAGLSASDCQTLRSNVAAEQQKLQDDLKNAKWYPVLNIGITIGF